MEDKKLFVIDLDGTALESFTTLHPKTIEGVNHIKSLGHYVVIATGRSSCACIGFYNDLQLDTPLISSNGAYLTHPKDESFVGWKKRIDQNLIKFILTPEVIKEIDNMYYYYDNTLYIHKYEEILYEKLMMTGCNVEVKALNEGDAVTSMALVTLKNNVEKIRGIIRDKFTEQNFDSWDGAYHDAYIEVNAVGANKWNAICELAKYYNLKEENIYTFGDGSNDYVMIDQCKNGVAMGNAASKLKNVANIVLSKHNDEGALGEFLLTIEK